MSGTSSAAIAFSSATVRSNRGPSPSAKREPETHRVGHGQDVGEQDRRVERKPVERLQRHLASRATASARARGSCRLSRASRCTRAGSAPPGASARRACTASARGAGRGGICRFQGVGIARSAIRKAPRAYPTHGRSPIADRRSPRHSARQLGASPSGTRRPRARTAGLRGSPRRRATGRAACRRRRRPSAPTCGSRRCRPSRCCARRARRRAAASIASRTDRRSPSRAARGRPSSRTRCRESRPSSSRRPRPCATRRAPRRASRRARSVAFEALGRDRPVARAAFLVRRRRAQLDRPVRPRQRLVLLLGRLRQQLELRDRRRAPGDSTCRRSRSRCRRRR